MQITMKQEIRQWRLFNQGDEKIFAVLHTPVEETTALVITMHGFASHKVGTGRSYVALAESLAKEGIASLRFDFRGCGDSEGDGAQMTLEGYIDDALLVIESMKAEGYESLGLFGSSFGGAIGVLSAARSEAFKAMVLWAPVASGMLWFKDFVSKHPKAATLPIEQAFSMYRGVPINPDFRKQFGQMNVGEPLKELGQVPLLHFQGEKDDTLSLDHQNVFKVARENSIAPSRFVSIPGADHWLGHSDVLPKVIQETVSWFKTYLV